MTETTKRASKAPAKKAQPTKRAPSPETNGDEDIFYLNVRIATTLRDRMEGYCQTYGVGRRYVVTRALEDFLSSRDQNPVP